MTLAWWSWGTGSALALGALAVAACTAPPIPNDIALPPVRADAGAEEGEARSATTTSAEASVDDAGVVEAGPATASSCAAEPTKGRCLDCCADQNPASRAFLDDASKKCLCEAPGLCQSECATSFCAGENPTPGGACAQCLDDNGDFCDAVAETLCAGDATCRQIYACRDASGCDDKPRH